MSDESKEWVTIKIPETTRDKAREDPRTYGEIMDAGLSSDKHHGQLAHGADIDTDAITEEIQDEIDALAFDGAITDEEAQRIMSSLETIETRVGRVESMVEGMGGR